MKSDVVLLGENFEKKTTVSIEEIDINPLYCVSLPGYSWQCGLKLLIVNYKPFKQLISAPEN